VLILVWLLLLGSSLFLLSYLDNVFKSNPQSQSFNSLSWSGYAISDDFANPPLEVTSISALWVVPTVSASFGDGYSSAWVGIGGQLDQSLIQAGTEQDSINGKAVYSVFYELLPNYAIAVSDITVSPGDLIAVSISLVDSSTNMWLIQIRDVTNGQSFSKNLIYNSSRSSGEWIMERPTLNKQLTSLSDFGNITFQNCNIKVDNSAGFISQFKYSQIKMTDQLDTLLTSVSAVNAEGSRFTVKYLTSN
jgi:hypothetical protein